MHLGRLAGGWLKQVRPNKLNRTRSRGQPEKSHHAAAYCAVLPSTRDHYILVIAILIMVGVVVIVVGIMVITGQMSGGLYYPEPPPPTRHRWYLADILIAWEKGVQ